MIAVLEILEKRKEYPIAVASPDDFSCREIGQVDPAILVEDPTISLYCFDDVARRALFVQTPEDVDITAGPFLYIEQYEHARRVLAIPYELFHRLAAAIDPPASLVFIHSTGRSGSTLLSRVFGEMDEVTSLSEPDVYTQVVAMRLRGARDEEIRSLLTSATTMLFNPAFTHGSSLHVLKFRSFSIEIADLLSAAFPTAGSLFLYRDLAASITSRARAFAVLERPPEANRATLARLATLAPLLAEELTQRPDLEGIEGLCLVWLSALRAYARLRQLGTPILAVCYEELMADPPGELARIVTYLDVSTDPRERGLLAFERDSQAGNSLSQEAVGYRSVHIDNRRWDLVRDLVRRYPIVGAGIPAASFDVP